MFSFFLFPSFFNTAFSYLLGNGNLPRLQSLPFPRSHYSALIKCCRARFHFRWLEPAAQPLALCLGCRVQDLAACLHTSWHGAGVPGHMGKPIASTIDTYFPFGGLERSLFEPNQCSLLAPARCEFAVPAPDPDSSSQALMDSIQILPMQAL